MGGRARKGASVGRISQTTTDLTLLAVHAHPDDESTSTGGILASYTLQGVRTVVVTCTNGELGDGPGGAKPGTAGHDPRAVAATRLAELRAACKLLDVSDLEILGYHDSGMVDWDDKQRPDVFCAVPLDTVAERIGGLLDQYRPQVVVTYDPDGTYQHPDHVHAARATALAVEMSSVPTRLYLKAHGTTYWQRLREALAHVGIDRPAPSDDQLRTLRRVQRSITTAVDVGHVVERKRNALLSHASQVGSSMAAKLPPEQFAYAFGVETYIRAGHPAGSSTVENDLFTGLRA